MPAIGGYIGEKGVRPQFVTRCVEKQLRQRCVFQCGGEICLLWGSCKPDEVKEVAERMRNVAEHVIERVDSEFPETGLRFAMQCFDMAQVRHGMADGGRRPLALTRTLLRGIVQLARILGVDAHMAVLEYTDTCTQLLERVKEGRPLANASNGQVWEEVLSEDFHTTCEPARPPLRVMPSLVRFYIAIEDGSAQVERGLGVLTGEEAAYKGGGEDLYDDLLVLKAGPEICADDVCESAIGDVKRLGKLGQRWATLWRTVFGARLGIYRKSQVGQRRGLKQGTYVACKAGILAATENAVLARKAESAGWLDEDRPTRFGVPESFIKSATGDRKSESFTNKKFTDFANLTKKKSWPMVRLSSARRNGLQAELERQLFLCRMRGALPFWRSLERDCLLQSLVSIRPLANRLKKYLVGCDV